MAGPFIFTWNKKKHLNIFLRKAGTHMRPRGRICGIDRTALLVNVVQVVVALYLTCSDSQVRDEQKDRAQCNEDKTDYF